MRFPDTPCGTGATHYHEAVRSSSPPETPLVIPLGVLAPGRARAALPLRREGPEKLTGLAKYADDLVFPGAWYGATIRSTEPHARLLGIDLDPEYDWSQVVVITAEDIPGDNVVSLIQDDQPVLVAVGGEIQHQAEPVCLLAAPDRAILRSGTASRQPAHRTAARRSSIRSSRTASSRISSWPRATWRRGWPQRTSWSRASTGSATRSSCTSRTRP